MSKCTGCECCNTSDAAAELNAERLAHLATMRERAATYLDALNAEKVAHLATRTELDKAVAWLDRCQWARSVIDLDSGPLEVQLATALGRVKRLTAALRGLTTWLSSWRHAVSIRAIGAEQAWAELEGLHNNGCAALADTQDAAPQPDLLAVAERVAMECAYLVRHPSGPEGEDGYNLDDIAQRIEHLDLAALLKETP